MMNGPNNRRRGGAPRGQAHARAVVEVCRLLERTDEIPPLAELARTAGLSAWHFHRVFKAATGLTPAAYAAAQRS